MFFVYVLKNELSGKIYIGYTGNLETRILRHNKVLPNKKTSFTSRNRGEWKYIYTESYPSRSEAMKREKELKSSRGREFIRTSQKG
jgi:putative endonuclease